MIPRPSSSLPALPTARGAGKDGQNEGTIINHLRTVHYKLGLVCDLCFGCPTMMADTLCTDTGMSIVLARVLPSHSLKLASMANIHHFYHHKAVP